MEIAEARARQSEDPQLFMVAFTAGWQAAAEGGDIDAKARQLGPDMAAGFVEGVTAWRARTATSRDYVPGSPAHVNHTSRTRNA